MCKFPESVMYAQISRNCFLVSVDSESSHVSLKINVWKIVFWCVVPTLFLKEEINNFSFKKSVEINTVIHPLFSLPSLLNCCLLVPLSYYNLDKSLILFNSKTTLRPILWMLPMSISINSPFSSSLLSPLLFTVAQIEQKISSQSFFMLKGKWTRNLSSFSL